MPLAEDLRSFRASHPQCSAIMFGDLGTGTVLYVCAHETLMQEDHDRLLEEAGRAFSPNAQAVFSALPSVDGPLSQIICVGPEGGSVFLRQSDTPDEVYCIRTTDVSNLPRAASTLSEIIRRYAV